jgi:hypothetical protein
MDSERRALRTREARLRRAAERQGFQVCKSRRRDRRALGYGRYWIADARTGDVIAGLTEPDPYAVPEMTLDEVEQWLSQDHR